VKVEPKTTGIAAIMPNCYTMKPMQLEWQTDPFIWIGQARRICSHFLFLSL